MAMGGERCSAEKEASKRFERGNSKEQRIPGRNLKISFGMTKKQQNIQKTEGEETGPRNTGAYG